MLGQSLEHHCCAPQYEDQFASPKYADHFTGLKGSDGDFNRCTEGLRPCTWFQRGQERKCSKTRADHARGYRCYSKKMTPVAINAIHVVFVHQALPYAPLPSAFFGFMLLLIDLQHSRLLVRMISSPESLRKVSAHYIRAYAILARSTAKTV
jgi:hypothetical protein